MGQFLALGDVLINRALLAYAIVGTDTEGPNVRLGFAGPNDGAPPELMLVGFEARSALRWLREDADFRDAGGPSFRHGQPSRDGSRGVPADCESAAGAFVAASTIPRSFVGNAAQSGR